MQIEASRATAGLKYLKETLTGRTPLAENAF